MGERFIPKNVFEKKEKSDFEFPFRTIQLLGPREFQQDYFLSGKLDKNGSNYQVNIVADGHGNDGELFAERAANKLMHELQNVEAEEIGEKQLKFVFEKADEDSKEIIGDGGTTMSVVLLSGKKVFGGYVGDSEVKLLGKQGIIHSLTPPHNLSSSDEELIRVASTGASISGNRIWVGNKGLNMTRAIGDYDFRPHLSAEPHIFGFDINPADKYLIIASDGLWNVSSENGKEEERNQRCNT